MQCWWWLEAASRSDINWSNMRLAVLRSIGEELKEAERTARVRVQKQRERGTFPSTSYKSFSEVYCDFGFIELDLDISGRTDLRVRLQQSAENSLWAGTDQNHREPVGTCLREPGCNLCAPARIYLPVCLSFFIYIYIYLKN